MEYTGKLYGKIGRKYIPLAIDSQEVDRLQQRERICQTLDEAGYAVVACRWGWINNGYDILLVTTDKERAIEKADWYADYRGGKYGASVYDTEGTEVYHASSSYGEPTMENNHRIDMFERIGNQISGEIEIGEEVTHEKAYKFYDDAKRICEILSKPNKEAKHDEGAA